MISFSRKDNKVLVRIRHGIFPQIPDSYFEFAISQEQEYQAELLFRQLEKELKYRLEKIKREQYNHGWRDAMKKGVKAKDRKQTWFAGNWSADI